MLDDAIFAVVRNGTTDVMQRFNLKQGDDATESISEDGETYKVYLDNITEVDITTGASYNDETNLTTFLLPDGYMSDKQLVLYDHSAGTTNNIGSYALVSKKYNNGTSKFDLTVNGNWLNENALLGYLYDMEVEFPTLYVSQQTCQSVRADVQGNLVIHRVKFNFGPLGVY